MWEAWWCPRWARASSPEMGCVADRSRSIPCPWQNRQHSRFLTRPVARPSQETTTGVISPFPHTTAATSGTRIVRRTRTSHTIASIPILRICGRTRANHTFAPTPVLGIFGRTRTGHTIASTQIIVASFPGFRGWDRPRWVRLARQAPVLPSDRLPERQSWVRFVALTAGSRAGQSGKWLRLIAFASPEHLLVERSGGDSALDHEWRPARLDAPLSHIWAPRWTSRRFDPPEGGPSRTRSLGSGESIV